jgi:hypothetical protein
MKDPSKADVLGVPRLRLGVASPPARWVGAGAADPASKAGAAFKRAWARTPMGIGDEGAARPRRRPRPRQIGDRDAGQRSHRRLGAWPGPQVRLAVNSRPD